MPVLIAVSGLLVPQGPASHFLRQHFLRYQSGEKTSSLPPKVAPRIDLQRPFGLTLGMTRRSVEEKYSLEQDLWDKGSYWLEGDPLSDELFEKYIARFFSERLCSLSAYARYMPEQDANRLIGQLSQRIAKEHGGPQFTEDGGKSVEWHIRKHSGNKARSIAIGFVRDYPTDDVGFWISFDAEPSYPCFSSP